MLTLQSVLILAAQVVLVLFVTWMCGTALARFRQPRVIGEILGGLLLGPLALGHVAPRFTQVLFVANRIHGLELLSNAGLVLFLFQIGMELDLRQIAKSRGTALAVTLGSICVPFAAGMAIAHFLADHFPAKNTQGIGFTLFAGVVFSITAFPVLARILDERLSTKLPIDDETASITLLAAAGNDLLGWALMAISLALVSGGSGQSLTTALRDLVLLLLYIGLIFVVVRPLLRFVRVRWPDSPLAVWLCGLLALTILSSYTTDKLGVHAFFGAFLAGLCVPIESNGERLFEHRFVSLLQPITRYTLPLFFALTGLRMQASSFNFEELRWLGVVLLVAIAGKIAGTAMFGRLSGLEWKAATCMGILMNTRGLVELIALNIGRSKGILSSELFTLLVLMAFVTTIMTVPLLTLFVRHESKV